MIFSLISSSPINFSIQNIKKEQSFANKDFNLISHNELNSGREMELLKPVMITHESISPDIAKKKMILEENEGLAIKGSKQMFMLCGFGYWVDGFRCFPLLALNFHMANYLNIHPSTLQIVQNCGNLPFVAKPLFGVLSDAFYIGGAHRLPYISIGVLIQVLSWGPLALMSVASKSLPAVMACVLLSNLGASIAEVAKDALVAEYGKAHKMPAIQSYAFMASAAGGVLGNLIGGFYLLRTHQTRSMFLAFASILALQFTLTTSMREESLGLPQLRDQASMKRSVFQNIKKQYDDLMVAVKEENIWKPLMWIVGSILAVPALSGSIFCYQTQYLNLDSSTIGMSKVTGQVVLFSLTALYGWFGKKVSMRQLVSFVQVTYAFSLLLDLILVLQLNLKLGISNEIFALCFSGLAETIAQFKILPFQVLLANLAPLGCEGSLMSFSAAALCLSSVTSGFLGVGLSSFLGITSGNYSSLPLGILVQLVAALVPLIFINNVPNAQPLSEKKSMRSKSKRTLKNRKVGTVALDIMYSHRRERELDLNGRLSKHD
ncbi:hypothetical protein Leryth_003395 [Lithospermum erythrorhizon]|nr:hypothetical protein Leryth_003395 [Lithospermum erythrorhizon]